MAVFKTRSLGKGLWYINGVKTNVKKNIYEDVKKGVTTTKETVFLMKYNVSTLYSLLCLQ